MSGRTLFRDGNTPRGLPTASHLVGHATNKRSVALPARIVSEGAWVAINQIGSALAALFSVRLLTELMEPQAYGLFTLLLGFSALAQGVAVNPFLQAMLRFYPDWSRRGSLGLVRAEGGRFIGSLVLALAGTVALASLALRPIAQEPAWLGVVVAAVLLLDSLRSFETSLFNAARRQRPMALWTTLDAWVRPLFAFAAIAYLGANAGAALIGYLLGSAVVAALFFVTTTREGATGQAPTTRDDPAVRPELRRSLWTYALPLMPIAIFGWISSVGDRYIIAGLLDLEQAGLYAAAYGLISRSYLMMCGIELVIRPIYHEALASGDRAHAKAALRAWLLAVALVGGAGLLLIWLLKDVIAALLLAEPYRFAAPMMPWIAAGYWLFAFSEVFTRICYAHYATTSVLLIAASGAVFSFAIMFPAILTFGLMGAAMAVPLYFGAQLLVAAILAQRAERGASQSKLRTTL
jgi:O-antigen/teichoic acid export membrane protein